MAATRRGKRCRRGCFVVGAVVESAAVSPRLLMTAGEQHAVDVLWHILRFPVGPRHVPDVSVHELVDRDPAGNSPGVVDLQPVAVVSDDEHLMPLRAAGGPEWDGPALMCSWGRISRRCRTVYASPGTDPRDSNAATNRGCALIRTDSRSTIGRNSTNVVDRR